MYFALFENFQLKETAWYFNQNHTTAVHSRRAIRNLYDCDPKFKTEVDEIYKILKP
jgi:chromosomal replication initiation ATPase DnaA